MVSRVTRASNPKQSHKQVQKWKNNKSPAQVLKRTRGQKAKTHRPGQSGERTLHWGGLCSCQKRLQGEKENYRDGDREKRKDVKGKAASLGKKKIAKGQ